MKRPIAGGAGSAAGLEVVLPHPRTTRPQRLTRFLESERALAALLLAPTVLILSTFIAPLTQFLGAIEATLRLPAIMADVLEREKSKVS